MQTLLHSIQAQPQLLQEFPSLQHCAVELPMKTLFDFVYLAEDFMILWNRGVYKRKFKGLTSFGEAWHQHKAPIIILCKAQYKRGDLSFWSSARRKLIKKMRTSTNIYRIRGLQHGFFVLEDTSGVNMVSLVSGRYLWNYMYKLNAQNSVSILGEPPNKLLRDGQSSNLLMSCTLGPAASKLYVVEGDTSNVLRVFDLPGST
jgi:hypothetical protein